MECENCGEPLEERWRSCPNCGVRTRGGEANRSGPPEEAPTGVRSPASAEVAAQMAEWVKWSVSASGRRVRRETGGHRHKRPLSSFRRRLLLRAGIAATAAALLVWLGDRMGLYLSWLRSGPVIVMAVIVVFGFAAQLIPEGAVRRIRRRYRRRKRSRARTSGR